MTCLALVRVCRVCRVCRVDEPSARAFSADDAVVGVMVNISARVRRPCANAGGEVCGQTCFKS